MVKAGWVDGKEEGYMSRNKREEARREGKRRSAVSYRGQIPMCVDPKSGDALLTRVSIASM
jgi:hypothetical protein